MKAFQRMNSSLQLAGILVLTAMPWVSAYAKMNDGGASTGGGDLCEDRIKIIRQDLRKWILDGGPRDLQLPRGKTVAQYSGQMIEKIDSAQINCVGPHDRGFPVMIGKTPKVCRFERVNGGAITCDFSKFNATDESDQYVLIHHEYAGLSGIEQPDQADSHYETSNQISGFLVDVTVKKLAVKPELPETQDARFCISEYNNIASYHGYYRTWCSGLEQFTTSTVNSDPRDEDFELVTRKLQSQNYHFVGAFFNQYSVLLHVNREVAPTEQYCVLAYRVEKRFLDADLEHYYLDCNEGSLQTLGSRDQVENYLKRERLKYVATIPQKLQIAMNDYNMRPHLYIYKRIRK